MKKKWTFLLIIPVVLFLFTLGSCSDSDILDEVSFTYDATSMYAYVDGAIDEDTDVNLDIPSTVRYEGDKYTVVGVNDDAFNSDTSLISIVLPDTVTSIGEQAFLRCSSLVRVDLGDGVKSIGNYAFNKCTILTNIELPDSLNDLGDGCFKSCVSLPSINIPSEITTIPTESFSSDTGLQYITADSIDTVENSAFSACTKLSYIYYSTSSIDSQSVGTNNSYFSSSTACFSVDLSENTEEDTYFFVYDEDDLTCDISGTKDFSATDLSDLPTEVSFNGETFDVDGIYSYAFYGSSITDVTLTSEITKLAKYAFYQTDITSFDTYNVTSCGLYCFANCTSLENINLQDCLLTIMQYAFKNDTSLTSVVLPESLVIIRTGLFKNCTALTTVTIQANVATINESVFDGCDSLSTINYCSSSDDWDSITIDSTTYSELTDVSFVYNYEI